jgi:dTDP-glucose pyrophosphorylase
MKTDLEKCQTPLDATLRDALRSLVSSGVEIVLVSDETGRLIGILTDGDFRRALLKGADLDSPLAPHLQRHFKAVTTLEGRAEALDLMRAFSLHEVPVVDDNGRLVGLHLMHNLITKAVLPHWAVIMAGGKGTRLHPITQRLPKPMISVAGRPILERLILHLVGCGIRRIFLAINYLGHMVEDHFGDGTRFGCHIEYLREEKELGTGGALKLIPEKPSHPLLVMNGDLVTQVDVGRMLDFHEAGGFTATMGLQSYRHEVPFGCVQTIDGRITLIEEKPTLEKQVNAGIYVLSPATLDLVPDEFFPITRLFELLLDRGDSIGAFEVLEDWLDVGRHDDLKQARGGFA